jgi:hypothetical protein
VLALTGSLPGERLKVSHRIPIRPIRSIDAISHTGVLLSRSVQSILQQIQFIYDPHVSV